MKVLVTGAGGFIGSALIPKLIVREHDVYGLERYVTTRYTEGSQRPYTLLHGDITDQHTIRHLIRHVQPEVLIHLASISANAYSYEHPQEVIDANFLGTVNLAQACMREVPNFKHFLFAGSSEEYGNNACVPQFEVSPLCPHSPYAIAKVASDYYLRYLFRAYKFPSTILRNFNTYGRKDNTHFLVEKTIVQGLTQKTLELGDPTPIRDLLYVEDHVQSYLSVLDNLDLSIGQVFNFATRKGMSILQLVSKICATCGFAGEVHWNTIPKRPLDIAVLVGDYTKANKVLGWKPKWSLEAGLKETIDYWRAKLAA